VAAECGVGSFSVVVVEPVVQGEGPLGGAGVGPLVGPFGEQGPVVPFDLPEAPMAVKPVWSR